MSRVGGRFYRMNATSAVKARRKMLWGAGIIPLNSVEEKPTLRVNRVEPIRGQLPGKLAAYNASTPVRPEEKCEKPSIFGPAYILNVTGLTDPSP